MIRPEDLREHLDKRPFEPFRIFMTDGKTYDITHPELCLVSRTTFLVGRPLSTRPGVANGVDHCALVHITRLEPLNGNQRRTPRKRKGT